MHKKRGQLSAELSIFLAILLIIFLVVFISSLSYISATRGQVTNYIGRDALSDIAVAAQKVYLGGNNSQETVKVQLPKSIVDSVVDTTVIGIITQTNEETQEQFLHDVEVPVSGALPTTYGVYDIILTSNGSTVNISYAS